MNPLPYQGWYNRKTGKSIAIESQHESGQVIYRHKGSKTRYYTEQKDFVKKFDQTHSVSRRRKSDDASVKSKKLSDYVTKGTLDILDLKTRTNP